MSGKKNREQERDGADDRPPICPACGVTQGIVVTRGDETKFVCLECGFTDEQ